MNNYANGANPDESFDYRDAKTYHGTKGNHIYTVESVEANEQMGFFEYIPWRGKTSTFWNDKYLYWDVDDVNSPGLIGEGVEPTIYFGGSPAGLWSLCAYKNEDGCAGGSFCGEDGSAVVRGIATSGTIKESDPQSFNFTPCDGQLEMTEKIYNRAQFCNGQSDDDSSCKEVNGYEYDTDGGVLLGFPANTHQTFYCMGYNDESDNACGPLTDKKEDLPFCNASGAVCGTFENHSGVDGCDYMCEGYCYWPGSDAINPLTKKVSDIDPLKWSGDATSREYKQCKNIAASEIAWESLKHAQGAFFGSIVVGQIAGLLVCKTRWLSITKQGMRNNFMLFGIASEIALVTSMAYFKPFNIALGTRNIRLVHWFCAIPFAMLILIFDESRKALMRATSVEKTDDRTGQVTRVPGWVEKNCAY